MKIKGYTISILFIVVTVYFKQKLSAQAFNKSDSALLKKIADSILSKTTFDFELPGESTGINNLTDNNFNNAAIIRSPYNEWKYWNGVLNIAMLRLADRYNEIKYRNFAINNYEFAFDHLQLFKKNFTSKVRWTYPFMTLFNTTQLDDCGAEGAGLIEVNQLKPRKDFNEYLQTAASHILKRQLRFSDGTLARSRPVVNTLWADDLYMSIVFLSRMGKWTGQQKYFDDAILQVLNFTKYLYNDKKGLYYHCWFSDNKTNGVAHWSRCNGWVMMAQIELLDHLPKNNSIRNKLIKILQQQIIGVARYQDVSGLWHQLLDKNDSYLETSGTAMFVYSIAKAVNNGWLDKRYADVAKAGWKGIKTNIQEDGQVKNICMGTGIASNISYYYTRAAPLNDIHGLGPVLLAGTEVMKLPKVVEDE